MAGGCLCAGRSGWSGLDIQPSRDPPEGGAGLSPRFHDTYGLSPFLFPSSAWEQCQ